MAKRTFAVGDIHGTLDLLHILLGRLPALDADDTLLFLGDYVDRGPKAAGVIDFVRHELPKRCPAQLVFLRGNHEDAWLRVVDSGFPQFVSPLSNGCLATLRSYTGGRRVAKNEAPTDREYDSLLRASFFKRDDLDWMRKLRLYHEDEHAIYVHAGLPKSKDGFAHPSTAQNTDEILWARSSSFFRNYKGKRVVCGHTPTEILPQELSTHTPLDPTDAWTNGDIVAIDTGCGHGGFLTALELPALRIYESRGYSGASTPL